MFLIKIRGGTVPTDNFKDYPGRGGHGEPGEVHMGTPQDSAEMC